MEGTHGLQTGLPILAKDPNWTFVPSSPTTTQSQRPTPLRGERDAYTRGPSSPQGPLTSRLEDDNKRRRTSHANLSGTTKRVSPSRGLVLPVLFLSVRRRPLVEHVDTCSGTRVSRDNLHSLSPYVPVTPVHPSR